MGEAAPSGSKLRITMYELTCPSCGHRMHPPFARIGANAACGHCGTRFKIGSDQWRHEWPQPAVAFGRSPATEKHGNAEARSEAASESAEETEEPALPDDLERETAQAARRARSRRRGGPIVIAMAGLALLLAIAVGGGAWWMSRKGAFRLGSAGATTGESAEADSEPTGLDLPRPELKRLAASTWRAIEREAPKNPDHNGLSLVDSRFLYGAGGSLAAYYVGTLVAKRSAPRLDLRMRLMLVDEEGRAYARSTLPVALISSAASLPVRISIPERFYKPETTLVWELVEQTIWQEGRMLEGARAKVVSQGPVLRAEIRNGSDQPLAPLVLGLTAVSERGRSLGHWKATWRKRLESGATVELALEPDPRRDAAAWRLAVAGRPATASGGES